MEMTYFNVDDKIITVTLDIPTQFFYIVVRSKCNFFRQIKLIYDIFFISPLPR